MRGKYPANIYQEERLLSQNKSSQNQLSQTKYTRETSAVPLGKGIILLETLTPVLSDKEREKRKREIESRLFDVFKKYA